MVETAVVMALLTQEMIQQGAELARPGTGRRDDLDGLLAPEYRDRTVATVYRHSGCRQDRMAGTVRDRSPAMEQVWGHPAFYLDEVGILPATDSVFTLVSGLLITGPDFTGRRFTNMAANSYPIDDVYVYKQTLEPPRPVGRRRRGRAA